MYARLEYLLLCVVSLGLNSGVFIGYLEALYGMVLRIDSVPKYLVANWPGTDQGLYSHIFLSGEFDIALDYSSSLFQCYGWDDDPFIVKKYKLRNVTRYTTADIIVEHKLDVEDSWPQIDPSSRTYIRGERYGGRGFKVHTNFAH